MRPKHCLLMSCVVYTRLFTNQISDTTVRTTVLNLVWTPNDKLNWFARNTTDGEGHSTKSKYCISNAKRMMGCVKKILHLVSHRRIQLDQLTPLLLAGQMLLTTILLPSFELPDTTTSVLQNAHRTNRAYSRWERVRAPHPRPRSTNARCGS